MTEKRNKNAKLDQADGYNPVGHKYWAEGEPGRKRGSKVPPAKRKRKRRRK